MSAKTSHSVPSRTNSDKTSVAGNLVADIGRQQLAVATDAASAMFRGSEAMRAIQQQAAHEASLRHQTAAQRLHRGCEPAELLAIQSELLRFDLQGATQYWQQITAAALQSQIEMMASATHLLDGEQGEGLKSALTSFQAAIASGNGFFTGRPGAAAEQRRA